MLVFNELHEARPKTEPQPAYRTAGGVTPAKD